MNWVNCFLYLPFSISSAGVGRTGVFIALTNLIERIITEAVVDVYQTAKKMRQQRTAIVQTRVRITYDVAYTERDARYIFSIV